MISDEDLSVSQQVAWWSVSRLCPICGTGKLIVKTKRDGTGRFVGCESFPTCRYTRNFTGAAAESQLANIAQLSEENDELKRKLAVAEQRAAGKPVATGPAANVESVKRKLRKLAVRFHPDVNPHGIDATEATRAILELREELDK